MGKSARATRLGNPHLVVSAKMAGENLVEIESKGPEIEGGTPCLLAPLKDSPGNLHFWIG